MKMALIGRDLWDIVTGVEVLADGASESARNAFRKRDYKALSNICLSINAELKVYARSAKTSKEAWQSLENYFEEKTLSKMVMYRRKMLRLKMEKETK